MAGLAPARPADKDAPLGGEATAAAADGGGAEGGGEEADGVDSDDSEDEAAPAGGAAASASPAKRPSSAPQQQGGAGTPGRRAAAAAGGVGDDEDDVDELSLEGLPWEVSGRAPVDRASTRTLTPAGLGQSSLWRLGSAFKPCHENFVMQVLAESSSAASLR
jgi:hypothetical protein